MLQMHAKEMTNRLNTRKHVRIRQAKANDHMSIVNECERQKCIIIIKKKATTALCKKNLWKLLHAPPKKEK